MGHRDLEDLGKPKFRTEFPFFSREKWPKCRRKRDWYEPLLTAMAQVLPFGAPDFAHNRLRPFKRRFGDSGVKIGATKTADPTTTDRIPHSRDRTKHDSQRQDRIFKNVLMPLFLMGCFPEDFQERKQSIKAFGETAHYGRKTAH